MGEKEPNIFVSGVIGGTIGALLMDVILVVSKALLGMPLLADFKVMGTSVGFGDSLAVPAGFIAHHIVGAVWGAIIAVVAHRGGLLAVRSWTSSLANGSLAGLIIYGIFFIPVLVFIFRPVMANMMGEDMASAMMSIVAGLGFTEHIVYGVSTLLFVSYYRR